ncbi:MAG: integration host factor [Coriobacteriales bacterium]|nr:integration host factor [Coriobacteriales bacterium]
MPLPQLSPEARAEALEKAKLARSARAALRAQIKSGEKKIADVLVEKDNPVIDKIKVLNLIESLPGYGKAKALKLLDELGISETRRVKGLGEKQRAALIERLG